MNDYNEFNTIVGVIVIVLIAIFIYLLPSIVAFSRQHPNRWLIFAINFFLGGTVIIWFICLIWAYHKIHDPKGISPSAGGESGLNLFQNDVKRVSLVQRPRSNSDLYDALARLAMLRDKGILTEEEFQIQKKKLL